MAEVGFYHLTRSPLEEALPRLLEKITASGRRAVVRATSRERLDHLNRSLWTYGKESFLPHGMQGDGFEEAQPVWLTLGEDVPNGAGVLVLVEGAEGPDLARFERCLDLFDGGDPRALEQARARWRAAQAGGHEAIYWQQGERGGWTRGALARGPASPS